jgi:XTP/dITP diphosphohydrolase
MRLLKGVPAEKRTARFRCVLALTHVAKSVESASPVCLAEESEFAIELFEGVCEGHIAFALSGKGGFGYDPLFIPVGHQQSFAQLGKDVKNQLSHRARALGKLRERLRGKNK